MKKYTTKQEQLDVASSLEASQEDLVLLAKSNNLYVRLNVAENPNTSADILDKLSKDAQYVVKNAVVRNDNTAEETLLKMLNREKAARGSGDSETAHIIGRIASSPKIPKDELEKIIYIENHTFEVLKAIMNPVLDSADLIKFVNSDFSKIPWTESRIDDFLFASTVLLRNPNANKDVIEEIYEKHGNNSTVRAQMCASPYVPIHLLEKLSDDVKSVRANIAKNSNTPSDVLKKLSKDEDIEVRLNVANNEKTPKECLIELSWDDDIRVCRATASNPKTPASILIELSSDRDSNIRSRVGSNPSTPFNILSALSRDRSNAVRESVVSNQNYLSNDSDLYAIYEKIKKNEVVLPDDYSKIDFVSEAFQSLDDEVKETITDYINEQSDKIVNAALEEDRLKQEQNSSITPSV